MPRTPASPEPAEPAKPAESAAPQPGPTAVYVPAPSYLDRVRANQAGPLAAGLVIGLLAGLLLSMLVPSPANVWALILLGALIAAAVGFGVRYLSVTRGWRAWVPAFLGTAFGVHVMGVTGSVNGAGLGNLGSMLGAKGPGFDDALLSALVTPAVSAGTVLAGLVAVIIAAWGPREES